MSKVGNALILSAHGRLASGLKSGINLIVGPMENLRVVDFEEGANYEMIDDGLKKAYDELANYKNVLILTDLMGGTPFNRSVMMFADNNNVRVLSGLNFASAYQALISEEEDIDKYVEEVLEAGHNGLKVYAQVKKEENLDEEGI